MRIYLAGPMRGLPESNFPAFNHAAGILRSIGHEVHNPADKENIKWETKCLENYMEVDLPEVCKCEAIVLLPGWLMSRGACLEYLVADYLRKKAYEFQENILDHLRYLRRKPFVVAAEAALMIERSGLAKHKGDSWAHEPRQNHTLKAGRHLMTHELISIGWAKPDNEDHLGNALCRVAMALAQEPSPENRRW